MAMYPIMVDGGPQTVYSNPLKAADVIAKLIIHETDGWHYKIRPLSNRRYVIEVYDQDNKFSGVL
jgi:hypothetical protein